MFFRPFIWENPHVVCEHKQTGEMADIQLFLNFKGLSPGCLALGFRQNRVCLKVSGFEVSGRAQASLGAKVRPEAQEIEEGKLKTQSGGLSCLRFWQKCCFLLSS